MVLPLLGILAFVILYLAVVHWYITIPIIVIVVWYFFFYNPKDSDKKEDYESRRSQSSSYQNYSQSDYSSYNSNYNSNYNSSYNSNYNSNSDDYYKKTTQDDSYKKSKSKSKRKSRRKSKGSEAKAKRVNYRLEKYKITPEEARIIFGRTWRSKLGKQEWEFYYVVRYIEIDIEFDYNNRARKKFGHLYSKVLQIIQVVMEENADMREEEGKQYKYSGYSYDDDFKWNYDEYDYKNHYGDDSDIGEEDIAKAFDTFGLSRESTKQQIKTKYRELTLKFHPDKNKSKDTTVKMTEINRAYEIIMGAVVQ
ncbi:chaperone protein DnaJ [Candidatus Nitrosomarinus catalina]|uniref:Chaperone protein DnaJ n=1 Tax=Candidatus Nitrosomarinus catalinensis TaxID=1898749 RepID=A0A2Z2HQC1_9ARCH|nr:DnaJ domain-containing protein [Candidatus Nitrosomarinus catalina]ARS64849.1 chaperone protein DnaJ [Candidatus Nitrosomarinus catalina]